MSKVVAFRPRPAAAPTAVNGRVSPPPRRTNAQLRPREFLTEAEVEALIKAAGAAGRHRERDKTLILVAYTHGLRVSELISLQWSQVDFQGYLHVKRRKNGRDATHPLRGREIRALRRLQRLYQGSRFVFTTERKGPLTASTVRWVVTRAGQQAGFAFPVHPHMLRHAIGYKLANDRHDTRHIQQYLGHRNIAHTVRYTELAADALDGFFAD